jgi:hypothetical protein
MRGDKSTKLEELRQPGMRRVLEAMKAIEKERPGFIEEAMLAAGELAKKNRGDGGRTRE